MRKLLALTLAIWLSAFISTTAVADQRFESWQGLCHFAYDANDDDNEVYFANCQNVIDTYDAGDGQGRMAYGTSIVSQKYTKKDGTTPDVDGFLKGADADSTVYQDKEYTSAPQIPCVMVTSNYDAGNDDNNETVYVTNDWNLEITPKHNKSDKLKFKLSCRNGIAQ